MEGDPNQIPPQIVISEENPQTLSENYLNESRNALREIIFKRNRALPVQNSIDSPIIDPEFQVFMNELNANSILVTDFVAYMQNVKDTFFDLFSQFLDFSTVNVILDSL